MMQILLSMTLLLPFFRLPALTASSLHTDTITANNKDPSVPTPYPHLFSVRFITNVTERDWSNPVESSLYYDWSKRAQRIAHGAGSYECQHFYNISTPCTLIFLPDEGMYRILNDDNNHPNSGDCCLDLPNVGAPPPDWASQAPYTWKGLRLDEVSGLMAYEWWFDKGTDETLDFSFPWKHHVMKENHASDTLPFHTMRQVATGQYADFPLLFTFPGKAEGRQDMHFLPHTMIQEVPPGNWLFEVPDKCRNRCCSEASGKPSSSAHFRSRGRQRPQTNQQKPKL